MRIAWLALAAVLACAHSTRVDLSRVALQIPPDPPVIALSLVDERSPDAAGTSPEVQEFASEIQGALAARGLPATVSVEGSGLPRLHLRTYRIAGVRPPSDFHGKWMTRVYLAADLETGARRRRIAAFGANPSSEDPLDPALPPRATLDEFAAKLANELYGYRASDATVREIADAVAPPGPSSELVHALGLTNNPTAIPIVARFAGDPTLADDVRIESLASLGTLRATGELAHLKAAYEAPDATWIARFIAAKSIGDLGTKEALDFIAAQKLRDPFVAPVVALYF